MLTCSRPNCLADIAFQDEVTSSLRNVLKTGNVRGVSLSYRICCSMALQELERRQPLSLWARNYSAPSFTSRGCWNWTHQTSEESRLFGRKWKNSRNWCAWKAVTSTGYIYEGPTHAQTSRSLCWMRQISWQAMPKALWGEWLRTTAPALVSASSATTSPRSSSRCPPVAWNSGSSLFHCRLN